LKFSEVCRKSNRPFADLLIFQLKINKIAAHFIGLIDFPQSFNCFAYFHHPLSEGTNHFL